MLHYLYAMCDFDQPKIYGFTGNTRMVCLQEVLLTISMLCARYLTYVLSSGFISLACSTISQQFKHDCGLSTIEIICYNGN